MRKEGIASSLSTQCLNVDNDRSEFRCHKRLPCAKKTREVQRMGGIDDGSLCARNANDDAAATTVESNLYLRLTYQASLEMLIHVTSTYNPNLFFVLLFQSLTRIKLPKTLVSAVLLRFEYLAHVMSTVIIRDRKGHRLIVKSIMCILLDEGFGGQHPRQRFHLELFPQISLKLEEKVLVREALAFR